MAYRNNSLMGPWETWRKFALGAMLALVVFMFILVNVPLGVLAVIFLSLLASVWKGIGVTDPTLGAYIPDTKPFKVAKFFMAYRMRRAQVLSPMVSLGFGPPTPDPDHDMDAPGWFPPARLAAYWSLFGALALCSLDYFLDAGVHPFWGVEYKLPVWLSVVLSGIGWFIMLQSIAATHRIQGDGKGIIAFEPAPATMLHKVRGYVKIGPVLYKALGIGVVPAFVAFVLWMTFSWNWIIGVSITGFALMSVFLVSLSIIVKNRYREQWEFRNQRREFWEGTLSFLKDNNPTFVAEAKLPTFEQWEEMVRDDDEPYAPKINVATFMFAPNANFGDYQGLEGRIQGALNATRVAIAPIEDIDEFTGQPLRGSISTQGFRIWWTEERLNIDDLLSPDLDPWMLEFGVKSIVLPGIAQVRGLGYSTLYSYNMATKKASDVQILQVKVVPPPNVALSDFLSALGSIETQLSVPWVRAYRESQVSSRDKDESRQVVTLLIGHNPESGKVKYSGSPLAMRRTIHTADWMYVFHINKVRGPRGTPLLLSDRATTPVVNEKVFRLPDGLDYNMVEMSISGLKDVSGNKFMEITKGAPEKGKKLSEKDEGKATAEQESKFTIIASREDPLARLFEYGSYKDKLALDREPGNDKILWHPGILSNDELAVDSFDSEEPSLLIAGSSGGGKSVVLQDMVVQLASKNSPDELQFWMVEPKIGLQRFMGIDSVTNFVDSWTPTEDFYENCANFFGNLVEEMKRRNRILAKHPKIPEKLFQARKIAKQEGPLPDGSPNPLMLPHIIVLVEECATVYTGALTKEDTELQKEILGNAMRIAREGRSAGIYLVNVTQYPTNAAIPMMIRQQSRRIGLKTRDSLASKVIIDQNGLEELNIKGTGLINQGYGYRKFRGFWLRDGDPDQGESNDIIDVVNSLPSGKLQTSWSSSGAGELIVPDPERAVFNTWESKAGRALDRAIDLGKSTKDLSGTLG